MNLKHSRNHNSGRQSEARQRCRECPCRYYTPPYLSPREKKPTKVDERMAYLNKSESAIAEHADTERETSCGAALPAPQRITPPPAIDVILEGASFILGTGIAGAQISLTYPKGGIAAAAVNDNGIWLAAVPPEERLSAGDVVCARQACEGERISDVAERTVLETART